MTTRTSATPSFLLLAFASSLLSACSGSSDNRSGRPDLGFVEDSLTGQAEISLTALHIRNQGETAGEGTLTLAILDSLGQKKQEVNLLGGATFRVPRLSLGGGMGRVVPADPQAFAQVVADILRSDAPFSLLARIATRGSDGQASDNVGTREFRRWMRLSPDSNVDLQFAFQVASTLRAPRAHLDVLRKPARSRLHSQTCDALRLESGQHACVVRFSTPGKMTDGAVLAVRLTIRDGETGVVAQQHIRIAAYDTIAPLLTSYRAVILGDGRVAVQVYAGDEDTGIPGYGVVTRYSVDGGQTWGRQHHSSIEDDFGRPAIFETVVGPFIRGREVMLAIEVHDHTGNTSRRLPADAAVFVAPRGAENLIDSLVGHPPVGNPLFSHHLVGRQTAWIADGNATLRRSGNSLSPDTVLSVFERRRVLELGVLPSLFRRWKIDAAEFRRENPSIVHTVERRESLITVRIPAE